MSTVADKWEKLGDWSPLPALKRVGETKWLIDGVIPAGSINWMVAAPQSFKTFLALDMAACIASGRPWHGRETDAGVVLYLAAEGGNDIHVRRAAVDLAADDTGPLCVVQMRPRLDETHGLASLLALAHNIGGIDGLQFPEVQAYEDVLYYAKGYLKPDEQASYDAIQRDDYPETLGGRQQREADLALIKPLGFDLENWWFDPDANRVLRSRYSSWDQAMAQGFDQGSWIPLISSLDACTVKNIFMVIDTYSQTSADDAKGTVSRYIKALRDLQDKAAALGGTVTVLVVDHTTKSGDSYMGSLAKEGDSDTMMEVDRHGDGHSVTLRCAKMKGGIPFQPIHLDLKPVTLEGFTDALNRPLTSLITVDGEKAHFIRKTAGAAKDTAASVLMRLLTESGPCTTDELRKRFSTQAGNTGKMQETINRAFLRAFDTLKAKEVILEGAEGIISLASDAAEEPSLI